MFRTTLSALALCTALPAFAQPAPSDWDAVTEAADGQTVYWHAWGGSTATNDFIAWIGDRVADEYGVTLEHVKLADTADAVTRVLSEKQAGEDEDGAVDLIWINGPNFKSMKEQDLLFGPFAEDLPNWQYVDVDGKTVQTDFTVPTEGYEAPWAMAQVVFMHDTEDLPEPLPTAEAILDWAEANPGRFTYPQPPDFLGTTFLKQMLIELVDDPAVLQQPVDEADYDTVVAPLWDYLDELTPNLWRSGDAYPQTRSTSPSRSARARRRPQSPTTACRPRSGPSCWRTAHWATRASWRSPTTRAPRPARWWSRTSSCPPRHRSARRIRTFWATAPCLTSPSSPKRTAPRSRRSTSASRLCRRRTWERCSPSRTPAG